MLLGSNRRWRRTGVSWRTVVADWSVHEYDDVQVRLLREVHRLLTSGSSYLVPETWLHLDACRSPALWSVLQEAAEAGVGLVTGGRAQAPLVLERRPVTPAADLVRTSGGLSLRPLLARGDPATGAPVEPPFALVGEPGIGVVTWAATEPVGDAVLTLAPFPEPLAPAAHAFLRLPAAIDVPEREEADFLAHHYRRLASVLPVVSRDATFEPPARPIAGLELRIEHEPGGVSGRWAWRYSSAERGTRSATRCRSDGSSPACAPRASTRPGPPAAASPSRRSRCTAWRPSHSRRPCCPRCGGCPR